jgi:hypothetical protein
MPLPSEIGKNKGKIRVITFDSQIEEDRKRKDPVEEPLFRR